MHGRVRHVGCTTAYQHTDHMVLYIYSVKVEILLCTVRMFQNGRWMLCARPEGGSEEGDNGGHCWPSSQVQSLLAVELRIFCRRSTGSSLICQVGDRISQ